MSKKPRRSRHRVPVLEMVSDPIDERYQREVDYSTSRLERAYRKAQAALEAAQRRADKAAQAAQVNLGDVRLQRESRKFDRLVAERVAELLRIEKLMVSVPWCGSNE